MRVITVLMLVVGGWLSACVSAVAEPPDGAQRMVRFYNRRTNEHCYAITARELSQWRSKSPDMKEHYALGLVGTKPSKGATRLYRNVRKRDGRQFYSFTELLDKATYQLDETNFQVWVWKEPGDGRIPIYCSTWIDDGDVFFERNPQSLEKFSTNTKKALGVDRLRPVSGPMFYVYPISAVKLAEDLPGKPPAGSTAVAESDKPAAEAQPSSTQEATGEPTEEPTKEPEDEQPVVFKELPLDSPATSFDMTEDGKYLVISHQADESVSIYDVLQHKIIKSVKCRSPRSVLCRGNHVFVANYGQGTISVLSRSDQWKLVDKLQVEKPNIVHMSAALGERFANELIVTCHGQGVQASYQDSHIYLVDTRKDKCRRIAGEALVSVSADGRLAITQGSFNLSPSGDIRVYNYQDFIRPGGKRESLYGGGVQQTPYVYQVWPGSYWLSQRLIVGGVPISEAMPADSSLIIPDYTQKLIYVITQDVIRAHRVATGFPDFEMRRVQYPARFSDFSKVNQHFYRTGGYMLDHPTAYVHGQRLHLFVLTGEGGAILSAETEAFDTAAATGAGEQVAASEPEADRHASISEELRQGIPAIIPAGREFRHRIKLSQPGTFELLSDIPGLTLSRNGDLRWRATEDQIGQHDVKVRVTSAGENAVERLTIEVVDAQLYSAANGDVDKMNRLQRLELEFDNYWVTPTNSGAKMLLLQGDRLSLLAGNGYQVERTFTLPKRYKYLLDRREYMVGVSLEAGHAIDIIDKSTMKVKISVDLQKAGANIAEVTDLAINPARLVSYVAVRHEDQMPQYSILTVDETAGRVETSDIFGTWVQVSPDGNRLYTGYRDIYRRGTSFHINPNWSLIEIPEYGNIDMLLSWDARGGGKALQAVTKPGANGHGIRLSPDGRRLTYLSYTGDAQSRGDLIGWNAADFKQSSVRYATRDRGSTTELAYHPWLPWLAVPGGTSAVLFDQDTGELLENKLQLMSSGLNGDKVERLYFSPDGKHLLFVCSSGEGRYLRAAGLRLTASELSAKRRAPIIPKADSGRGTSDRTDGARVEAGRAGIGHAAGVGRDSANMGGESSGPLTIVPVNELNALFRPVRVPTLTPKEIGKRYLDAVVSVTTDQGSGSGFFIGKTGYLLTSAHVIEDTRQVKVLHNRDVGKQFVPQESEAKVVRVDEALDVALLKIDGLREMPYVILATEPKVDTGEAVIVIGSPGLGEAILSRTMTSGIVSNPDRVINGQHYIQTSAAVNPGNSGGAMFDSRGHVIGLINMKGNIEGTGFATPAPVLREFLRQAVGRK